MQVCISIIHARVYYKHYPGYYYIIIDLVKVPTEEKHMQVYNKGGNWTHICIII